jgi:glyoxylase-like metal-dependent hydrolase (beta-lactamase superfamily II)
MRNQGRLFCSVLLSAMAVSAYGEESGIFHYKNGKIDVYTMVENSGPGRAGILIGDAAVIEKYAPGGSLRSATNTFLLKTARDTIVVDTGFGGNIFKHLETLKIKPLQITAVLITHMHGDHIGGLAKDGKALFPNAKVYLSKQELASVTGGGDLASKIRPASLAPYGDKVITFNPGTIESPENLLPGIGAAAAFGHTPGHTVFVLDSEGKKLVLWGDLMHAAEVQFPAPEIAVTYDSAVKEAIESRKNLLAWAAKSGSAIAGAHMVYPAIGFVQQDGAGYKFTPAK